MWQIRLLCFPGIEKDTARRAQGYGHVFTIESTKVAGTEVIVQGLAGTVQIEVPGWSTAQGAMGELAGQFSLAVDENLGRFQAFNFGLQRFQSADFIQHQTAAGDIHQCQAIDCLRVIADATLGNGQQAVVTACIQQRFIADRAGCNHPHDLPFYRALAGGRVANLLADGYGDTGIYQFHQITIDSMKRDAAHGNGLSGRLATCGQGDVENIGGAPGIVKEELVKVPHAIEQQVIRVLGLDAQKLLHHRSV